MTSENCLQNHEHHSISQAIHAKRGSMVFFQLVVLALAIILLSVSSQPYLLLGAVPVVMIFVWLRQYYVKTAREIKRIESLSKCIYLSI